MAELKRLLARTRLLTLTGSGGCGKTRLCLQGAADSLERFPDGVWLVELAPLADAGLVPQTVATVLGLMEEPGKSIVQTLTEHLKDKRLLLLLDNCEHLLDGCAQLVDTLMRQCPNMTILASSREALGIGGEQAYRVPSLSLPDPKQAHTPISIAPFEAVQLFTDRALLARADFEVTNQNAPSARFHLLSPGRDSAGHRVGGGAGVVPFRSRRSTASWTNASDSSRLARVRRCHGIRHCARRSIGAMTFSLPLSARYWCDLRCSPEASPSTARKPLASAAMWPTWTCSTCWVSWWGSRWWRST